MTPSLMAFGHEVEDDLETIPVSLGDQGVEILQHAEHGAKLKLLVN